MSKLLLNLNGVQKLNKEEQKEINGGRYSLYCRKHSDCWRIERASFCDRRNYCVFL